MVKMIKETAYALFGEKVHSFRGSLKMIELFQLEKTVRRTDITIQNISLLQNR